MLRSKLAYGTDEIYGYIGNVWRIVNSKINKFFIEYEALEKYYLKKIQNPNRELKGSIIVKGNFSYGISSLKNNNITFLVNFLNFLRNINLITFFFY